MLTAAARSAWRTKPELPILMRYSTRTLAVIVAALAFTFALLRYSNETSAMIAVGVSAILVLVAAALVIGTRPPRRLFWIGFIVAALGARYLESDDQKLFEGLPRTSVLISDALDDYLLPNTIPAVGKPNATDYWLSETGGSVRYVTRNDDGKIQNQGSMRIATARSQGVDITTLKTRGNPDTNSFGLLIKEFFIALIGIAGGLVAYLAGRPTSSALD